MEGLAFKFDWFKEVLGGCDAAAPCFVVTSSLEALTLSKEAFGVAESYEKFHKKNVNLSSSKCLRILHFVQFLLL